MKSEYDVIIIGAGPAGSSAARRLKEANIDVLVAEKETLPRYKCCSGMIFPRAIKYVNKYFGYIPKDILCKEETLKEIKFFLSKDNCVDMPLEYFLEGEEDKSYPKEILSTWRKDFDYWLIKNSKAEVVDNMKFVNLKKEGNYSIVNFEKDGKRLDIKCRYLIGADGGNSHVRDTLNPELRKMIPWLFAYEEHYEGEIDLDPECYWGFMDRSFSEFYTALYIKDDTIQFANGIMQGSKIEPYIENFINYLKVNHGFKPKKRIFKGGCIMAAMSVINKFYFGEGNVLLTGEAAGFLNLIGEGISSAITTGYIAGEAVLKSMSSNKTALDEYVPLIDKEREITLKSIELGKQFGF
jgi:flavin-dependent dehydrogenase